MTAWSIVKQLLPLGQSVPKMAMPQTPIAVKLHFQFSLERDTMTADSTHRFELSAQACEAARMARDARFDGRFFVAVKTTGIFCRPICPAPLPREENVEYFVHAAQALQAGYRPCLRCRPDSAPHSWAWKGSETTFIRALTLIEQGALQQHSLEELAERLGISSRYLRRLFQRHLNMSPKQYALYQQLMFAKQLLHHSDMRITDIAFAAGFNSLRRFNDAFQKILRLTPADIQHAAKSDEQTDQPKTLWHMVLTPRTPFNWSQMLAFYRSRAITGLENVTDTYYQRHFQLAQAHGWFRAHLQDQQLHITFELSDIRLLRELTMRLHRMFDLDADSIAIENHLSTIEPALIRHRGLRIPGVWNCWEAGVRAVVAQQISVKAAITVLNNLYQHLIAIPGKAARFPTPADVHHGDLSSLKITARRRQTLKDLAQFCLEHPNAPPSAWLALKGIGPWTVQYAQLRGESLPDCLLDSDLVVKNTLQRFPALSRMTASPWGSYATFHCWTHA